MGLFSRTPKEEPVPEFSPMMVGQILGDVARTMIYDYEDSHGGRPDVMSATLEFDELMRVAKVSNPVADGVPFIPRPPVYEQLNRIVRPFLGAPESGRPLSLSFTFDHGTFDANLGYPPAP